jgi:hypothetical protein
MRFGSLGCALLTVCLAGGIARADTILYIDDTSGNIGQVDLTTHATVAGSVHNTGLGVNLTDIGFNSTGTLYGTTFTGLYSINTSTGAATSLGSYGTESGMNALVGSGGTALLGAADDSNKVYSINPASPGSPSTYATSPADSAGDLAFSGTTLYESAINAATGNDELVNVTTGTVVGLFHVGTTGGAELSGVFGLADDGTTMYGVDGNTVYSVNLSNGVLTDLFTYGGGLGAANGTAFIGEGSTASTPEPGSIALLGSVLIGVVGIARRRRQAR